MSVESAHSLLWSCAEEKDVSRLNWVVVMVEDEVEELLEFSCTAQLPRSCRCEVAVALASGGRRRAHSSVDFFVGFCAFSTVFGGEATILSASSSSSWMVGRLTTSVVSPSMVGSDHFSRAPIISSKLEVVTCCSSVYCTLSLPSK